VSYPDSLISVVASLQDKKEYENLHWEGSFEDYLKIVKEDPKVTRTSFQRLYDMIMGFGRQEYIDSKKRLIHYHFFDDPIENGRDAIFGLDIPLMRLVNVIKSAALGYGTERRVILLHGPVGSSKSTIARLLKKGIEHYSKTVEGKLYTFAWNMPKELHHISGGQEIFLDPLHEEPLKLLPSEMRDRVISHLKLGTDHHSIRLKGDLNPASRHIFRLLMEFYRGDIGRVLSHVRVRRLLLSEKDRVGIGTFQPKDEKNQDSTELTGDINYRKIAEFGSDSDPRAFNFDGEFCVANRGIIEFIEILKLDVAFLYDLLGATQEHKIKPKKFANWPYQ
jgi:serine protein kinase